MKKLTGRIEALRFHLANWIRPKRLMVNNLTLHDWLVYHQEKIVFDQASWMGISTLKKEAVLEDLEVYSKFVTAESYLIVEDGIVDIMKSEFGWKQ